MAWDKFSECLSPHHVVTYFVMLLNFVLPTLLRQLLAYNLELQDVAQLHRDAPFGCNQLPDARE